jgi:hypothetical protein
MGIHLAAEGFKVEGFFGCHGNLKYTVNTHEAGRIQFLTGSAQAGVQVGQQGGHLLVGKATVKGWHHSLTREYDVLNLGIGCGCSAWQSGMHEDTVEIRWSLFQIQVVLIMAMGAANVVKVFAFCLQRSEGRFGMATDYTEAEDHSGKKDWQGARPGC